MQITADNNMSLDLVVKEQTNIKNMHPLRLLKSYQEIFSSR